MAHTDRYPAKGKRNKGNGEKPEPIFSDAKSGLYGIWAFTLFWNAICWPVIIVGYSELVGQFQRGEWLPVLAILFPIVGVLALVVAIKRAIEWRRFGVTPLFLNPFPGSIGGHVAGTICLPESIPRDIRYDVSLVCVYTYETRDAENKRSSAERMIWQHSQAAHLRRGMDSMNLLFRFDVPEGLPRSESKSGNYHHWRIHVHAEMDGVDLNRHFDIPVHPTNEHTTLGLKQSFRKNANQYLEQLSELMRVETAPGLLRMCFPPGRRKLLGACIGSVGLLLLLAGFFMLRQGGGDQGEFVWTFAGLIFLLVSGPVILLGVYIPCNALHVRVGKDVITVRRTVFGMGLYRKKVAIARVTDVALEESGRSQSGKTRKVAYRIVARGGSGERLVLAEGLYGKPLAEEALRFIRINGNLAL